MTAFSLSLSPSLPAACRRTSLISAVKYHASALKLSLLHTQKGTVISLGAFLKYPFFQKALSTYLP